MNTKSSKIAKVDKYVRKKNIQKVPRVPYGHMTSKCLCMYCTVLYVAALPPRNAITYLSTYGTGTGTVLKGWWLHNMLFLRTGTGTYCTVWHTIRRLIVFPISLTVYEKRTVTTIIP